MSDRVGWSTAKEIHHRVGWSTAKEIHHRVGWSTAKEIHHRVGWSTAKEIIIPAGAKVEIKKSMKGGAAILVNDVVYFFEGADSDYANFID